MKNNKVVKNNGREQKIPLDDALLDAFLRGELPAEQEQKVLTLLDMSDVRDSESEPQKSLTQAFRNLPEIELPASLHEKLVAIPQQQLKLGEIAGNIDPSKISRVSKSLNLDLGLASDKK